jgi:hypothetical protein
MANMKRKTALSHLYGAGVRPAKTRRQLAREIDRLRAQLKRPTLSSGEIQALRVAIKQKSALLDAPTRNFSKAAVKAAEKFRGLKTAQVDTQLKKARADAIKRAVKEFYGLK